MPRKCSECDWWRALVNSVGGYGRCRVTAPLWAASGSSPIILGTTNCDECAVFVLAAPDAPENADSEDAKC